MKHRTAHHDQPKTLFEVIENIIYDLEEIVPMTTERDLIVQALLGLLVAAQVERDARHAA